MRAAPFLFLLSLAASPVLAQSPPAPATSIGLAPSAAPETNVQQVRGSEEGLPRTSGAAPLPRSETGASGDSRSGAASSQGDKHNQRVQRIRIEDKGSRVDEVRVGGQTKSITVTPKTGDMPAYEVQPSHDQHDRSSSGTTGPRVWNMLKF